MIRHCIRLLAVDTSVWTDDVWVVDSTPVECGRSRETAKRSELAGWAEYGYCASHSRYFWGLRLHLVCTLQGLPVAFALAGAKADERVLTGMLTAGPDLVAARPGQTLIGGQELLRRHLRGRHRRRRDQAAAARPQRRAPASRRAPVQAPAADHRIGQRHLQRPA
jgi:DDE family transposase